MSEEKTKLTFGEAIEALKNGKKVVRKGWNGKGMFLTLQQGSEVDGSLMRNENAKNFYGNGKVKICPHIDIRAVSGFHVDMLADEKAGQGVSLTAAEVRRLIFTAYKMGIVEGRKGEEK